MTDHPHTEPSELIGEGSDTDYVAVTFDSCDHVTGPFFHGTRTAFEVADQIVPGRPSNYQEGRVSNHVYFAALLEPAVWGAELSVALKGGEGPGHIYVVAPTGPLRGRSERDEQEVPRQHHAVLPNSPPTAHRS